MSSRCREPPGDGALSEVLLDAIAVMPFCRGHGSDSTRQPADAALLWVLGGYLGFVGISWSLRPITLISILFLDPSECAVSMMNLLLIRRHSSYFASRSGGY